MVLGSFSINSRTSDDKEDLDSMESLKTSNDSSPEHYESGDDAMLPRAELGLPAGSEYIPGMLGSAMPPVDEKYLDNSGSYYTSSFQARPQAEYFDFDDKYKYRPENNDEDVREATHESSEKQEETGDNKELLHNMINICKIAFLDMINDIDGALLTKTNYQTTDTASSPMSANKNLWDILELVTSIFNSEGDANASSLVPAAMLNPHLPKKSIIEDPCAHLPNYGVVLIKSPASISQLWDEYTKKPSEWPITDLLTFILQQQGSQHVNLVVKRQTSIQQLEAQLGSSWRNFDKNFSRQINRRKKIWRAIEEGLADGITLQDCFSILEKHAKERGSGLSWYYNGVPFKLIDMKDKS